MAESPDRSARIARVASKAVPLLLLAGASIAYYSMHAQRVTATPVVRGKAIAAVYATGTVEAVQRVTVKAKTHGTLAKLLVREGDVVHEGDVLAEIDNPAVTFDHERGTSDLAVAHALSAGNSPRLAALRAQAKSLRVQLESAALELARGQKLHASGGMPEAERDRLRAHTDQLKQLLEASLAERRALRISLSGDLNRQSSQMHALDAQLRDTQVRSPLAGVVLTRSVQRGETLSPSQPMFVIADTRELVLELWIDEADIAQVSDGSAGKSGSSAAVSLLAFPKQIFDGRVVEILPDADRAKKAFLTKVRLAAPPVGLRSGMTAEVNIVVDVRDGLLAPAGAESRGTIWIAEHGRAVRRKVTTGIRDPLQVQIESGLQPGELVIVEGHEELSEGSRLDVVVREPDKYQPIPDSSPTAGISL